MMTEQDRNNHALYESMPLGLQGTINEAFTAAMGVLREGGVSCPMDDRAEAVVAALARFVYESGTTKTGTTR